ncbi:MAG: hypothetical protein JW739_04680 [Opitutales bacterium]|nr:hypothetical protein [Opitutales bacterium]
MDNSDRWNRLRLKTALCVVSVALSLVLFLLPGLRLGFVDEPTDAYFNEALLKAGAAYGTARVINASASVIKDSELQVEPAGLGVTIAAGEIVDPIDDLVERLSDVLITAIASLGVQKILYEIAVSLFPVLMASVLLAFSGLVWCPWPLAERLQLLCLRFGLLLLIGRFFLPMSAFINAGLDAAYFAPRISETRTELEVFSSQMDAFRDTQLPEVDGFFKTIENSADFVKKQASEFRAMLRLIADNLTSITANLLELTWLYVGTFIIQVILLPIGCFALLIRCFNALFGKELPVLLRHS